MKEHEYDCFLAGLGLEKEELVSYDMFGKKTISPADVKGYDAVIIGGSGDYSAYNEEGLEFLGELKAFMNHCLTVNIPVLGVCFGMQLAAAAFAGEVIEDNEQKEAGVFKIFLTEQGSQNSIFEGLSDSFDAVIGHMDCVSRLPENAVLLAYSKKCPIQAFTFPNKNFYMFQFHSELSKEGMLERLRFYFNKGYAKQEEIDDISNNAPLVTEPMRILKNFKKIVEENAKKRPL